MSKEVSLETLSVARQTISQLTESTDQESLDGMFKQVATLALDAHASLICKLNELLNRSDDQPQNLGRCFCRRKEQDMTRFLLAADDVMLVIGRRLEESERERSELTLEYASREQMLRSQSEQRANEHE